MKPYIKKSQIILLIAFLFCELGQAQFTANLLLNNRPPSYLSDWNSGLAGQLLVTYTGQLSSTQVKFATQLQDANGSIIGISNNASAQFITINKGANVIRMDRVLQLENLRFVGGGNALATGGKLSAGQYFLSVQLLGPVRDSIVTQPQVRPFSQINYQLPYLLSPMDNTELDANTAQTAIIFRWSSLVPLVQDVVTYRLQAFEILNDQTPMQAFRANQPILLVDVNRATQYIWRPQLSFKDSANHAFIWTVQTLDGKGVPVSSPQENSQGRSEPASFKVVNLKRAL